VTINNVRISNVGHSGLEVFGDDNTVRLANTIFDGTFGDYAVSLDGASNTLSGTGNVFTGPPLQLCFAPLGQSGNFTFSLPAATCP
jgi:hypothetical protein